MDNLEEHRHIEDDQSSVSYSDHLLIKNTAIFNFLSLLTCQSSPI